MKFFVLLGLVCTCALALPTDNLETKEMGEAKTDAEAALLMTEDAESTKVKRDYGYKPEHKGYGHHHGGHGYGHKEQHHGYGHKQEHHGHGYGHKEQHHGYGHKEHHGHGYGHKQEHHGYGHGGHHHGGHGYGHKEQHHGYGHKQEHGHGYGHKEQHHGYGHKEHHGYKQEHHGYGHGHGYKAAADQAEGFEAASDFVASSHYGGHGGHSYGHAHVQPVHHQVHSYGAHAPHVQCGSNLLVGCNVHTAKAPCVPSHSYGHGGYGHAQPAHYGHAAQPAHYGHKQQAHHGYRADEEKEQPKEDKQ